ncbi:hypothetical protein [Clostridium ljungdahlii]|uniref:hypothetical protein n=1 Tax=Clostridium ljungdahlii TaxID=1538 RepID=UPI00386A7E9E
MDRQKLFTDYPKHGPRVRWVSILTDLPLNPTGKEIEQKCGECMACVKICPQKAFYGKNYIEGEDCEKRFDVKKCDSYLMKWSITNKYLSAACVCIYALMVGKIINNSIFARIEF